MADKNNKTPKNERKLMTDFFTTPTKLLARASLDESSEANAVDLENETPTVPDLSPSPSCSQTHSNIPNNPIPTEELVQVKPYQPSDVMLSNDDTKRSIQFKW